MRALRFIAAAAISGSLFGLMAIVAPTAQEAESGELWVTSQGTDRLFIVHGQGSSIETIPLPGTGPHITMFSPLGDYAYVSGMRNGTLSILRADDRQVVQTLNLGPTLTHQAKPSPDGSVLLVTQIATRTLIKIAADEAAESWHEVGRLSFPVGVAPVCSVFRDDGQRAYVSLLPTGIAIVDVPSLTQIGTLATDGFVACGMTMSKRGRIVTLASARPALSGGGGHVYRLDTATDTLTDAGILAAADWHSFHMSANEKIGFGTSPHSDEIVLADLTGPTVRPITTLPLDPTPGIGNDQPDAINPGVRGNTLFVSLRASGQLAIVKVNQRTATFLQLSPPAPFNPTNCGPPLPQPPTGEGGCAVHGVTVRP
jgi:DNA-binding beta-propeller fold protein YncE